MLRSSRTVAVQGNEALALALVVDMLVLLVMHEVVTLRISTD